MKPAFGLLLCLLASPVLAQGSSLGQTAYGGTGCQPGDLEIVLGDENDFQFAFERFSASAGGTTLRADERQACDLSIPINVPAGRSVALVGIDYAGVNQLGQSASSTINIQGFFAGARIPSVSERFSGPLEAPFAGSKTLSSPQWSDCGDSGLLRITVSLRVMTSNTVPASISLAANGDDHALSFRLETRDC